jgi:polyhydroxybutyrate depolymerase
MAAMNAPRQVHAHRSARWLVAGLLGALIAATLPPTAGDASTSAAVADTAAPCPDPDGLSIGDNRFYRQVGPSGRRYQLYVPTSYRGNRPVPLILDFHPFTGTASIEELFNGFEEVAEEAGFLLARPEALTPEGGLGPTWSLYGSEDVEYVEAVLADVRSVVCVDPARTYAAGMSQGGHFATQLACRLPGTFAAVATVAVLDHPFECAPPPTPIIAFAGRNDRIYDIEDGLDPAIFELSFPDAPDGARPGPLEDEADAWAGANGCQPEPIVTSSTNGLQRITYPCPHHVGTLIFVHDGGHVWPGPWLDPQLAEELGIGPATNQIDATRTIWRFFKQYQRRE